MVGTFISGRMIFPGGLSLPHESSAPSGTQFECELDGFSIKKATKLSTVDPTIREAIRDLQVIQTAHIITKDEFLRLRLSGVPVKALYYTKTGVIVENITFSVDDTGAFIDFEKGV